jgi:hypothetical protein
VTFKTAEDAQGPAAKAGTGPQTLVVPAGQRGVITDIHGSSVTGGAVTINLGAGALQLGILPANGRIDASFEPGVLMGDPDFDIVLAAPADFNGGIFGYITSGSS